MGKRAFCSRCNKALSACICDYIQHIDNQHFLHILQDPSEENKAVGTARILDLSLSRVKLTVAEHFQERDFDLKNSFLLFPGEDAKDLVTLRTDKKITVDSQFIVLDGSWKKAYKLLMNNPFLQKVQKVSLAVDQKSAYRIRKSPREDGLSTVEAGFHLLSTLENNADKFTSLLDVFNKMIDYQISCMPAEVYQKHYLDKGNQ